MSKTISIIPSTSNLGKLGIIKYEAVDSAGMIYTSFDGKTFRMCVKTRFAYLNDLADPAKTPDKAAIRQKYLSGSYPVVNVKDLIVVRPVEKKAEPVAEVTETPTEAVATA